MHPALLMSQFLAVLALFIGVRRLLAIPAERRLAAAAEVVDTLPGTAVSYDTGRDEATWRRAYSRL